MEAQIDRDAIAAMDNAGLPDGGLFTPDQFEKVMLECKDMTSTEFDEKFAAHMDELIGD